jgi:UDP-2,3-diacylglucosamine pyrophosphatase LpxH
MRVCIPDLHYPFSNDAAIAKVIDYIKLNSKNISHVIQLGDLYDFLAFSRFPKSLNGYTPREEVKLAREKAEAFWKAVRKACPEAKCHQLLGNHDMRPIKSLLAKAPEFQDFVQLDRLFNFEGVKTQPDDREELKISTAIYIHGYLTRPGEHARHNLCSVVHGHTHRGGVQYLGMGKRIIWELDCGYLGDRGSSAMSYTAQRKHSIWTLGFGVVDRHGPRFIPLGTNQ